MVEQNNDEYIMTPSSQSPTQSSPAPQAAACDESVRMVVTARDTGARFAETDAPARNSTGAPSGAVVEIQVDEEKQTIIGFGGAFTEAGAHALSELPPARREEVIRAYFDPTRGLGYTLCRTHINSCDFSLGNYAYCEVPGDMKLENFSIARDHQLLIPFIRDAQRISANEIRFLASPWSPPAWMKSNGAMNDGGHLKPEFRGVWAQYFARYIKAYAEVGIPIWAITVQNEPRAHQTWDSCLYTHAEQRDLYATILDRPLPRKGLATSRSWYGITTRTRSWTAPISFFPIPPRPATSGGWPFTGMGETDFDSLEHLARNDFRNRPCCSRRAARRMGSASGRGIWGNAMPIPSSGTSTIGRQAGSIGTWFLIARAGPNHVGNYLRCPHHRGRGNGLDSLPERLLLHRPFQPLHPARRRVSGRNHKRVRGGSNQRAEPGWIDCGRGPEPIR